MRFASLLPFALSLLAVGCTHEGVAAGPTGAASLRGLQSQPPSNSITIEGYGDVGPSATLTIRTKSQGPASIVASDLCRAEDGLYRRHATLGCVQSTRIALWDEIEEIKVEEFDGLSTVAVTAGAAIIVAGAVVMATTAAGAGKSSSSPSSAPRTPAKPTVPPSSPTPPAPVRDLPGRSAGASDHYHTHSSTTVLVLPGYSGYSGPGYTGVPAPSMVGSYGGGPSGPGTPVPLFDEHAAERDRFAVFGRLGASICVARRDCAAGSVMMGTRFSNFLELSGGAQMDRGAEGTRVMPQIGVGIQGTAPTERWLALYLGSTFSTNLSDFRVDPAIGFRLLPTQTVTIGIMPLAFSYGSTTSRFFWTPGLDLTASF